MRGVKRRFEYQVKKSNIVYIDDYAHHPMEIRAFISSVKSLYPDKKIMAIFQPHLYTRTRDFVDGFAGSLDLADEVLLMDIYPARELPIEGISSEIILKKMKNPHKSMVANEALLQRISSSDAAVILTVGAGDIDRFVQPIKELLEKRK